MAPVRNSRTAEDVRRDLEAERDQLATAADSLRERIGEATNVAAKLRANLPLFSRHLQLPISLGVDLPLTP